MLCLNQIYSLYCIEEQLLGLGGSGEMAIGRFGRQAKRPYGFFVKMTAVAILGLCFIFVWSMFSSTSSDVTSQRSTFGDIAEPVSASTKVIDSESLPKKKEVENHQVTEEKKKVEFESGLDGNGKKIVNGSVPVGGHSVKGHSTKKKNEKEAVGSRKKSDKVKLPIEKEKSGKDVSEGEEQNENKEEEEEEELGVDDDKEESVDGDGEEADGEFIVTMEDDSVEKEDDESGESRSKKKKKIRGPLFDPKAHYSWKSCSTRTKYNYIPCIDIEVGTGKMQSYRHRERSCPRMPLMCLVPLPPEGYSSPVRWPESKFKVIRDESVCFLELRYVVC